MRSMRVFHWMGRGAARCLLGVFMAGAPTQASGPAAGQGWARPAWRQRSSSAWKRGVPCGEVLSAVVEGGFACGGLDAAGGHAAAGGTAFVEEGDLVTSGLEGGGAG